MRFLLLKQMTSVQRICSVIIKSIVFLILELLWSNKPDRHVSLYLYLKADSS
jgi:hypothetical protein